MKKLLFAASLVLALGFYSCDTEPTGSELDAVEISAGITTDSGCLEESLAPIPEITDACIVGQGTTSATGAYWDIEILDGVWSGVYPGWCIDEDLGFDTSCFQADVMSSYQDLSSLPFEVADNFDSMNWLLNQDIIGTLSSVDGNPFTYGDFQQAIWIMVEGEAALAGSGLGSWDLARATEIADLALTQGDGFVPASGDYTGIVLIPENNQQSLLIPYRLECKPALASCETAFARAPNGDNCFRDNGFKRWGWTIGPLSEGTNETYDIYAGAGKCDISKGTFVGTVDVSYIDGNVDVTYNFLDGVISSETHTYAGNAMFPTNKKGKPTVAPGQYSIQEDLSGDIYVIAHAVVCGDDDDDD